MISLVKKTSFLILCFFTLSWSLQAAQTVIKTNTTGEPSLVTNTPGFTSVLNTLYGSGNYTRVGDGADTTWSATNASLSVVAGFTGSTNSVGYFAGTSGPANASTFHQLFTVNGSGYKVSGSTNSFTNSLFRFGLKSDTVLNTVNYLSSLPSNNKLDIPSEMDHMVTFKITGSSGGFGKNPIGSYITAWEDWVGPASDRDFNDTIVLVKGAHPTGAPEPATYLILMSGLMIGMVLKMRRRQIA